MKQKAITGLVFILCAIALLAGAESVSSYPGNGTEVLSNDTCKKIDAYLTGLEKDNHFSGGLLIVKDGKQIFCKGYGLADREKGIPFTPTTLASMGSITKAFTAAGILKLVEQNKLALSDSIKKFFPEVPADKAGITIHQLLTHSSGFHEFLTDDGGDYEVIGKDAFIKKLFAEKLDFKPGEKGVYSNVSMSLLAIIIEKASGLDYEAYLKSNFFDSIGIKQLGYRYPVAAGDTIAVGYEKGKRWGTHQEHFAKAGGGPYWNIKGNGGLEVSLNDMFKWVNAISNHSILSQADVEKMFTPYVVETGYNGRSSFGYGCNIVKSRRNTKMIDNGGSNGIYFARLIRLPEEGLVFYIVTNESAMNANMVLPNVTQLYFQGKIEQDAITSHQRFDNPVSKHIYELLDNLEIKDLGAELTKENLKIDDDQVLLQAGQVLVDEGKPAKALVLYQYYTRVFPEIVVAWNDMGDIYQTLKDKDAAIKCYRQAIKLRPGNPRALENLDKLSK